MLVNNMRHIDDWCQRQPAYQGLGGVSITDPDVVQESIGQLCYQFKLPTMAPSRWPALPPSATATPCTPSLEILEQEAEDPRHRRINRLRKDSRLPPARPSRISNTTGCP